MAPQELSPHGSMADHDFDDKHEVKDTAHHLERSDGEHAHFATMSAEDRAAALKLAHEADPGPEIASYRFLCFLATCFVVIVNSCDTGFDTTIMSSVNSMLTFQVRRAHCVEICYFAKSTGLLWSGICLYWYRYPLCEFRAWLDTAPHDSRHRVSTPLVVSLRLSQTSSCPISLAESTRWPTETLYSCELGLHRYAQTSLTEQYRCHHLCQRQVLSDASGRPMAHWFRLFDCRLVRQDLPRRDHFAQVARTIHGRLELFLLWSVADYPWYGARLMQSQSARSSLLVLPSLSASFRPKPRGGPVCTCSALLLLSTSPLSSSSTNLPVGCTLEAARTRPSRSWLDTTREMAISIRLLSNCRSWRLKKTFPSMVATGDSGTSDACSTRDPTDTDSDYAQ